MSESQLVRRAALAFAAVLVVAGCSFHDPSPGPSPSPSVSATAPSQADVVAADQAVRTAIEAGDSIGLQSALSQAGRLAGRQALAAGPRSELQRDKRLRRAYEVARWWTNQYAADVDFSRVFKDGRLRPYATLGRSSSALEDLNTLSFRIENDWKKKTGDRLSFNDTYDAAFDQELKRP